MAQFSVIRGLAVVRSFVDGDRVFQPPSSHAMTPTNPDLDLQIMISLCERGRVAEAELMFQSYLLKHPLSQQH